jgi:hypothetical protein
LPKNYPKGLKVDPHTLQKQFVKKFGKIRIYKHPTVAQNLYWFATDKFVIVTIRAKLFLRKQSYHIYQVY